MKVKNIHILLFVALTLISCAPPVMVSSPTSTSPSIPLAATNTPSPTVETLAPTREQLGRLSAAGPWLLYVHNSPRPAMPGSDGVPPEFILLNQDGTARTTLASPECYDDGVNDFLINEPHSNNYLAEYEGGLYLFRPSQAAGMLVYPCQTFFNGNEKGGMLASFDQSATDGSPELIIYELPTGNIRDRFPLVRCGDNAKICNEHPSNWNEMSAQEPQWSPNGRYLAFAAILDADSSDLFVYDSQDGSFRRLTDGQDWVGPIEWSPDGSQIIMQEILDDREFFLAPMSFPPSSVWSVSMSTNEIKLLYSTEGAYDRQNILLWLDNKHFVAYTGSLVNANQAYNLRFVDLEADTNRILFDGAFGTISFDPIHQTFVLYALYPEPYPQGLYLVSIKNGMINPLDGPQSFPDWDANTGLFLSSDTCENDRQSFQAFDYQGNLTCVRKSTPTPEPLEIPGYPAPNGKWAIFVKDGLWLKLDDQAEILVSQEIPSEIIWCPDSSCFFFSVFQPDQEQQQQWTLYRVSLPDLVIKTVDEGIGSRGSYQWLGGEK